MQLRFKTRHHIPVNMLTKRVAILDQAVLKKQASADPERFS